IGVNGLFEREMVVKDCLPIDATAAFNYLLCKKVSSSGDKPPDSRNPGLLRARFALIGEFRSTIAPGETIQVQIEIENTGDTLWLVNPAAPKGTVRLGVKILSRKNEVVDEFHGSPPLPRAIAPGEKVALKITRPAPKTAGDYILKID